MNKLSFIKALFSPFKPFGVKFYCGKTQLGVPYFFPRKWVKYTKQDVYETALKDVVNPKSIHYGKDINDVSEKYKNYKKAIPKKIGFDFVGLGWKTKWEDTDYRFEWSPRLSFVFFGYQIALSVVSEYNHTYWEAWLYYERNTDKSKSKKERIEQCYLEFPQIHKVYYSDKREEIIDYYRLILKKKYYDLIKSNVIQQDGF
jgi:hypothetical protein